MKKTVLTFGLIAGLIVSVLMGGSLLLADKIGTGQWHEHLGPAPRAIGSRWGTAWPAAS